MRQHTTVFATVIALIMALDPHTGNAQERPALLLSTEVFGTTAAHCLDKAEQTLIQFGAGLSIFKNGDLRVAGLGAGGTVAVYCLPNGNPNQVQIVFAVATSQLGPGQSLLTNFVHDFDGNVRNPL